MTTTRTMVLGFVLSLLLAAGLLAVGGSIWAGATEEQLATACYFDRLGANSPHPLADCGFVVDQ